MKRLVSFALTLIVVWVAIVPARAQTNPPGGQPPGYTLCNHAAYVIADPKIGGVTDPLITADDVATVPLASIDRTTTAITYEVWRVQDKPDAFHWVIEFVGYTTTPAMMGICATPGGDIPDIIIDDEAPAAAGVGAGGIFYRDCVEVLDDLAKALSDAGFVLPSFAMSLTNCLPFFWATAQATCLTLGPAMVAMIKERGQMFRTNSPSHWGIIIYAAYEGTATVMQSRLMTFCLARGLI